MPIIPRTQGDLSSLAESIIAGVTSHPEDFPNVDIAPYQQIRDLYLQASADFTNAQSQANIAAEEKNERFRSLETATRRLLKHAFADCYNNPAKLSEIGWAPRRPAQTLVPPSQPTNLTTIAETSDTVILSWKKSSAKYGGPVSAYEIERRFWRKEEIEHPTENVEHSTLNNEKWQLIATTYNNEVILKEQPQGCKLEYRVKASNTAGESLPSNTVYVIL